MSVKDSKEIVTDMTLLHEDSGTIDENIFQISREEDIGYIRSKLDNAKIKVAQKLLILNVWNSRIRSFVFSLRSTLYELNLENVVPLCQRKHIFNPNAQNIGINTDIIRLSHSEVSDLLTGLPLLVYLCLSNVECIPDIHCGCESGLSHAGISYSNLGTTYVRFECTARAISIRSEIFANDDIQNLLYIFPFTCVTSELLTTIEISDVLLCHTQLAFFMCHFPTLDKVLLRNVMCIEDYNCGCRALNRKNQNLIRNKSTNVKSFTLRFDSEISKTLESSFDRPVTALNVFRHIESAPNLSVVECDGVNDIEATNDFFSTVQLSHMSPLRIRLANVDINEHTIYWIVDQSNVDLKLELVNVTLQNAEKVRGVLQHHMGTSIKRWTVDKQNVTAKIRMKPSEDTQKGYAATTEDAEMINVVSMPNKECVRQRVSRFHAWPAYEFTSKHAANVITHCRKVLQRYGLFDAEDAMNLENRLFRNINLNVFTKEDSVKKRFDNIFKCLLEQIHYREVPHTLLNRIPITTKRRFETDNITYFDPIILVAESNDVEAIKEISDVAEDILAKTCRTHVILIDELNNKEKTPTELKVPRSVRVCRTTPDTLYEDTDDQLELYAFESLHEISRRLRLLMSILKDSIDKRQDCSEGLKHSLHLKEHGLMWNENAVNAESSDKEADLVEVEEILRRIGAMYKRSNVHLPDHLKGPCMETKRIEEKVVVDILNTDNVVGCGERYGTLYVYVNKEILAEIKQKDKLENEVKSILRKGGEIYPHAIHYVNSKICLLSRCGAMIGDPKKALGTLGGFATKREKRRMCALISEHVAKQYDIPVISLSPDIKGMILTPLEGPLDIAAVSIKPSDIDKCDTRFEDDENRHKQCSLFDHTNEVLTFFDMVFIRGAETSLGYGELTHSTYNALGDLPHLLISDCKTKVGSEKKFCNSGDSGAIVCGCDRRGNMYALGMVVGEILGKPGTYLALRLTDGLDQLSITHGETFEWIDSA